MIFTIRKGKHGDKPFRIGLYFGRDLFRWKVMFFPSCKYNHAGVDQLDTNKLIGVGYLPGHHTDSARFGWRYVTDINMIELIAYCYVKGKRIMKPIGTCEIGKEIQIELHITPWSYVFSLNGIDVKVDHNHKKRFSYRLGAFFGGNIPAPHEMKISIKAV